MRSVLVVAAPAFQHNCTFCAHSLEGYRGLHVCGACGMPQPLSVEEDYFSAFGFQRGFNLDPSDLQNRFYDLSRILHPDRFTTSKNEAKSLSLHRMSFLNQAYAALRDSASRRDYLLRLEGIDVKGKGSIPIELAESWFEIQDMIMESASAADNEPTSGVGTGTAAAHIKDRIDQFEIELGRLDRQIEEELNRLEGEYDTHISQLTSATAGVISTDVLKKMALEIQAGNYISSLAKDVERIKLGIKHNANTN